MGDLGPLLLLAVPVLLLVFLMSRQRGQQREMLALQRSLEVGQDVMTAAGLYARIVAIDGDVVTLETLPGQPSRWDRRAIVKVGAAPVETTDGDAAAPTTMPTVQSTTQPTTQPPAAPQDATPRTQPPAGT